MVAFLSLLLRKLRQIIDMGLAVFFMLFKVNSLAEGMDMFESDSGLQFCKVNFLQ